MNTIRIKSSGELQKGDWLRILILWALVMILRYGVFCLLIFVGAQNCLSQENQVNRSAFRAGEVLRYKVKWSFIRLGSLEIRQEAWDSVDGTCYRIILTAESALGLPFIDVYFVNQGKVSAETLESLEFTSDIGREKRSRSVHQTDTAAKILALAEFVDNNLIRSDTLHINQLVYDDPSLFMLFRCLAGSGDTREVSSVMESRIETTTFRFPVEREEIEVEALDHPVSAFRFEGKAK